MNATTTTALGIAVATVMLFSQNAFAQATTSGADDKSVTGNVCAPGLNTAITDLSYRASFVKNVAFGYRWVACSIPIDSEITWNLADNNGGVDSGLAILRIGVNYGGYGGDTRCTAQIVNRSNGAIIESSAATVTGTAGNQYTLTLPAMELGSADTNALGVNCLLQAGVKLHVLNIEEYAETHQPTVHP